MKKYFFTLMGGVFLVVALIGFAPSIIASLLQGNLDFPIRVHLHAVIMFGWLFLFIAQGLLVAKGHGRLHSALGLFSVVLFTALWFSIVTVSVKGLIAPVPPHVEKLLDNIFFLQLCAFVLAPALYVMALAERRKRPDWHKRYMLFLTFFLIEASASRMTWLPGMSNDATFLLAQYVYLDLLLIPLIVFDVKTLGRVSGATLMGFFILGVYQIVALMVWDSAWWLETVNVIEARLAQWPG